MLLHDLIFDRESSRAGHAAVIRKDEHLTYAETCQAIRELAHGFINLGVRPGDRIAIYLNKRTEAVIAYFACSYAGAVMVPVNPALKPPQVAHILNDCDVVVLLTSHAQATGLSDAISDCKSLRHVITIDSPIDAGTVTSLEWSDVLERQSSLSPQSRIDNDIAAILYTSGSTGKPKGVVLSHRNMVSGALSVSSYLENSPEDIILAVLPFSFDAGFSQMTTAFTVGASVVLMDYLLPRDVIKAAARHKATGLAGVPPLWTQLSRLDWPAEAVQNLRYITNTGGAMPTATLSALRERLPDTRVYLMYGLTEAFRSTYLPPEELDRRPTSIGKAIPNAEIMVVRPDGTQCEAGEPGELVHRGALVALGYWNDRERTERRFRPAPGQPSGLPFPEIAVWSGDSVKKDHEGFLYFVGRMDDMIKTSSYRVSPTEVEEVIYGTGKVNECAALGIPHLDLGQAIVIACFSNDPGDETEKAIIQACKRSLPNYMVPTRILFRDALPRNPNGKIDRKALTSEYSDLFNEE